MKQSKIIRYYFIRTDTGCRRNHFPNHKIRPNECIPRFGTIVAGNTKNTNCESEYIYSSFIYRGLHAPAHLHFLPAQEPDGIRNKIVFPLSPVPIPTICPNCIDREIFPNRIRGIAMATCTFALWVGCCTLTFSFPSMNAALGSSGTFWIYSAICACAFVFLFRNCPETKGKSLEQLESELAK